MTRFGPNGYIQRIDVCKTCVHDGQPVTHQTRIKSYHPCNCETLVMSKTLTNVTFAGWTQQVINQTRIKGSTHM